jgi:hypothetical protein
MKLFYAFGNQLRMTENEVVSSIFLHTIEYLIGAWRLSQQNYPTPAR